MSSPEPIAPLLEALGASTAWLKAARRKGALIGGVAASLHGRPRVTRDIDLVVLAPDGEWAELVNARTRSEPLARPGLRRGAAQCGIEPPLRPNLGT